MKVLVTGAAGFIGYHVTKRLIREGHDVVAIDSLNEYYDVSLKYGRLEELGIKADEISPGIISTGQNGLRFSLVNICHKSDLERIISEENPDAICHLAAQAGVRYSLSHPQEYIDSNITGFLNILELCREYGILNLSYASSSSVYGLNRDQPFSVSQNVDHPVSLYAASKKSNEMMAHAYSHLFGIQTTGMRFFTVYGPWGRPDMALFRFVKNILEGKPIDLYNNGEMERDFTYIDDIVRSIITIIENPPVSDETLSDFDSQPHRSSAPFTIHNIGNGNPVKLLDFIEVIEEKLGKQAVRNMMPMQPGDVPSTFSDMSYFAERFGSQDRVQIEEGVGKFIDWYLQYYGVENS
jgi:UDP-glucuronate 4-epimerase